MVTIYDVAALAGVSPATVSRVLNGVAVRPGFAERVRSAAEELNYRPNRTAQTLRRRRSALIALIIPDIENPFFTAVARGVEDRALNAELSLVLCNTDEDPAKEERYLEVALAEQMAGVILAPADHHPRLDLLVASNTAVVVVDRPAHGFAVDTVLLDDVAAARTGTQRLYDQGSALVGCITGPPAVDTALNRADGWREVFRGRNPDADPEDYLRYANYRVDGGRAAMRSLLALPTPPDAVFVSNNLMGVGAIQAMGDNPVSLLVLGDLPFGSSAPAGVATLALPARELGTTAADLLLKRISGGSADPREVVIDPEAYSAPPD